MYLGSISHRQVGGLIPLSVGVLAGVQEKGGSHHVEGWGGLTRSA